MMLQNGQQICTISFLKVEQLTLLPIGDNMMYNDNIIMILYMFIIILIFKTCRQKCIYWDGHIMYVVQIHNIFSSL